MLHLTLWFIERLHITGKRQWQTFIYTNSSSSMNNDYGTLTVKFLNPDNDTRVLVYPYMTDYDELPPIEVAEVNANKKSVSFKLAEGNYVVRCKYGWFNSGLDQKQSVQIRSGKSVTLESNSQGLKKK